MLDGYIHREHPIIHVTASIRIVIVEYVNVCVAELLFSEVLPGVSEISVVVGVDPVIGGSVGSDSV